MTTTAFILIPTLVLLAGLYVGSLAVCAHLAVADRWSS